MQHTSLESQVPRAGVEPARVAPLVFETSASTDSAIWAFDSVFLIRTSAIETSFIALGLSSVAGAKIRHFCETAKLFAYLLKKNTIFAVEKPKNDKK